MSAATLARLLQARLSVGAWHLSSATWRATALLTSMGFAIGWTVSLGKDVHWDALNYHLYLGFSALNDRFTQDFFPAGPPSYLNPYAYVPLHLMNEAGWSALGTATALAAWHSLALWLTYEIALAAGIARRGSSLHAFALLAVLLAAINPVLLQGLGSTMIDLSVAVPVLAGWLALTRCVRDGSPRLATIAGLLCGLGAGLKLSNAVFAIAAVPALAFFAGGIATRARAVAFFALACALGFAIVSLPWAWPLWREFGNPFFPFLNQYFASPDFTSEPLRYERFIPSTVHAFLWRPFEMLSAASAVHTEPRAPDMRYVALLVALVTWAVAAGRSKRRPAQGAQRQSSDAGERRALASLLVGLAAAWILWLAISGNSRYFLPMACIASAGLALVLQRLHAVWHSATIGAIIVALAVQGAQFALGTDWKRDGGAWDGPWLRVDVPQRLRDEPYLYLSGAFMSGSAFAPYLHPRSGLVNVGGFNTLAPGHPGGARVDALIARNGGRLRVLVPLPPGVVDHSTLPGSPEALDVYVRRFGLQVDGSDCEFLRVEANLRGERRPSGSHWRHFIACRLVSAPEARNAYARLAAELDPVFDRAEDVCPNLFHPRRSPIQEYRFAARTYQMGSEAQLYLDEGRLKYYFALRGGDPIDIGSVDAWRQAPQPIDCSVRTRPAFVRP